MAQFIAKFRIDYSDVIVVKDPMKRPSQESIDSFNDLLKDFRVPDEPSETWELIMHLFLVLGTRTSSGWC